MRTRACVVGDIVDGTVHVYNPLVVTKEVINVNKSLSSYSLRVICVVVLWRGPV